ncbi:Putative signal transducing protein [Hymenobacter daecheongensis DSM 21074]|uniref:Putative signal transducing protein n=1 Tax=Hymenobacter daecheongensis DSM 21074 TaxID=1121955 RepID=A0A1M6ANJ9_9BACT|nr:DUF2007 domain-containing protein [Hymenobacter daecheongensis]SHI38084.1 Putative signal transducing protein [Hymenobacter daecheongensis DSM 21074]
MTTQPPEDRIVLLESYADPIAAHLAKGRLEAEQIPCFLTNENLVSLNRLYGPASGGVRLHVRQQDAAAAAEILRYETVPMHASHADDAPAADVPHCPNCDSTDVAFGPATRNTYSWPMLLLSMLLAYPLRGHRYHCFHCRHEFKRAEVVKW